MRNLLVLSDHAYCFEQGEGSEEGHDSHICCFTVDFSQDVLMMLTSNGRVHRSFINAFFSQDEPFLPSYFCQAEETTERDWFSLEYVDEISLPVGISLTGTICTLEGDVCEQQGVIEGGISAAEWSPDYGRILIVTNNNSLLAMTSTWDILDEVPIEPKALNSHVCISWRGDGEYVAIYSVDETDKMGRVRIFNRDLELHAIGRQVGDGAAAEIKGLVPALAFASNGGLIAVGQKKGGKGKLFVCLLEKNGLKHGEIEIQSPSGENWEIESLHWDLPCNLLAVTLALSSSSSSSSLARKGAVQLYYCNNYHWYCKQCWSGNALKCMGFDKEVMNKLYLSSCYEGKVVIRVIELVWDITQSTSTDCTTAVVDGSQVLLTPLAFATIPPPMSKYQMTMPSFVRYISFWNNQTGVANSFGGMVCLCESNKICICEFLDEKGTPNQIDIKIIDLTAFIRTLEGGENYNDEGSIVYTSLKSAMMIETKKNSGTVDLIVTATPLNYLEGKDSLHIFSISRESWQVMSHTFKILHGVANRIVSWPYVEEKAIAIGVISKYGMDDFNYEVHRVSVETNIEGGDGTGMEVDVDTRVGIFPEVCVSLTVAASTEGDDNKGVLCFGLSSKNKLYVGELLMKSGVNSFALNVQMGMLMYVTVGTRPHLHFCSLEAISHLDPLMFENNYQLPIEYALPRPLERGAKLVATILNDPKVVIQLPRGNIEAFEPRPLILVYACRLLDQNDFYNCLVLLRRQKVDLNFIIDYNPKNFLDNVELVVSSIIQNNNNSDILGLLISSLEDYDSTVVKYIIPGISPRIYPDSFLKDGKVNSVCIALRYVLSAALPNNTKALNPILVTLARQRPPLLIDALNVIRRVSNNVLDGSKCVGALKYLAFLANSDQIFNAALENCDFRMATSIAKISQMDPKIYIPLIESFEAVGNVYDVENVDGNKDIILEKETKDEVGRIFNYFMRYKIHIHLKKIEEGVVWCIRALKSCYEFVLHSSSDSEIQYRAGLLAVDEFNNVQNDIFFLIRDNDLFASVLPLLRGVLIDLKITSANSGSNRYGHLLQGLLSKLLVAFGHKCCMGMKYDEAIVSFLSTTPPSAQEAVNAARMNYDWKTAIAIAGRYMHQSDELNPKNLVQDIIHDYRETLEQVDYDDGDEGIGNFPLPSLLYDPLKSLEIPAEMDCPVEAARLCVDFLDDTDGAVAILLVAHKWMQAINLAISKNRIDLLSDDINTAVTNEAKQILKQIMKRGKKHIELTTELNENVWKNGEQRLQNISTTEATLAAILSGDVANTENIDDQSSEFTAETKYSQSSFVSNLSSQLSSSMMSAQSNMSASSTVSILSHNSSATRNTENGDFSIKGIDHGLLSRGAGDGTRKNVTLSGATKGKKEKKQRNRNSNRQKRGEGRSEGKDVWDLRNELDTCEKLLGMANVAGVCRSVLSLCQALLVLSENIGPNVNDGTLIACQLQTAMDEYVNILENNVCTNAPSYPSEWLQKRNMTVIRHFQAFDDVKDANVLLFNQLINKGIEMWKDQMRRVTLSHSMMRTISNDQGSL